MAKTLPETVTIEMPSGGLVDIDVDVYLTFRPPCGDGFHAPYEPAHWELDGFDVTGMTWYHPDGDYTTLACSKGSMLQQWLNALLDEREELVLGSALANSHWSALANSHMGIPLR